MRVPEWWRGKKKPKPPRLGSKVEEHAKKLATLTIKYDITPPKLHPRYVRGALLVIPNYMHHWTPDLKKYSEMPSTKPRPAMAGQQHPEANEPQPGEEETGELPRAPYALGERGAHDFARKIVAGTWPDVRKLRRFGFHVRAYPKEGGMREFQAVLLNDPKMLERVVKDKAVRRFIIKDDTTGAVGFYPPLYVISPRKPVKGGKSAAINPNWAPFRKVYVAELKRLAAVKSRAQLY